MYGYHHGCPSCGTRMQYGRVCCGNPLGDMLVMEGILDGDMSEVMIGEMMGSGIDPLSAMVMEEAFDSDW